MRSDCDESKLTAAKSDRERGRQERAKEKEGIRDMAGMKALISTLYGILPITR